ncbi:hypothetical protein L228DRAFT_227093 [Xylona heveae TC161]|uniref:Fe2OG dioxygenase domain-containing protein n=1 Tax=Xylona heveae (strain CBS 132557 / TC161) TaxID=1328760 RepID=A0A165INE0_XYLHT|nr:hypothetical protein L228DRAFT_227093 [Xylona heveae TC161]KZF25150.1 hypothetical protein L228DRAFT_227093 [Xylona heveae TC161]
METKIDSRHAKVSAPPTVQFDPARHLEFSPPSTILPMKDLGYDSTALSPVAVTEPFPLLSHEGVLQHRRELFSDDVLDNCLSHTYPGSVQLRGMAPRYAPFIHQFWHSPELLKIVSDLAQVELVPAMDYEISHANVQLGPGGIDAVRKTPIEPPAATATEENGDSEESAPVENPDRKEEIIKWHKDSHPWVCVVMLSDARHMVGGETELLKADGSSLKVRAPQMGGAVLLQGRYITHTAIPATNMPERITIVTSFRPKDPMLLDETTNANVRNKSQLSELYYQWTTYRLEVLAERARLTLASLQERYRENVKKADAQGEEGFCRMETINVPEMEKWANEQMKYLQQTLYEMRPLTA